MTFYYLQKSTDTKKYALWHLHKKICFLTKKCFSPYFLQKSSFFNIPKNGKFQLESQDRNFGSFCPIFWFLQIGICIGKNEKMLFLSEIFYRTNGAVTQEYDTRWCEGLIKKIPNVARIKARLCSRQFRTLSHLFLLFLPPSLTHPTPLTSTV